MDEAQAYFNEIQRLESEKLRHHPSSETGKNYSEMIKKKKVIINQLRKVISLISYNNEIRQYENAKITIKIKTFL